MSSNGRINFERILCPIGLTPDSDEALRYAIALAKAYRAKLLVLHCAGAYAMADSIDRCHIETSLVDSITKHLRLSVSPALDAEVVVVEGDPLVAITREAAERRIDLIVMRSRRRPYAAALLGSTAETLCRTAPCPILITHQREQEWVGMTTNEVALQRVLVAHDFSSDSQLALSYGLSLAQEYQAELHVLHVLAPRVRSQAPEIAMLPLSAETAFDEAVNRLRHAVPEEAYLWCKVKQAVREGHPYREVLDYAEEQDVDLICMGASGTGFGMHALFGSNADRVLRQAPCPTLIARPLKPTMAASSSARIQGQYQGV
jgi:nucleotide-binding universal stress UspA family protein